MLKAQEFAAACTALLALRGEFDLDANVVEFSPDTRPHDPPVTITHFQDLATRVVPGRAWGYSSADGGKFVLEPR